MSTLADAIKARFGNQYLIEITNNDSSATTINEIVLECACDDAQGEFNRITGDSYDSTIKAHTSTCIKGVLYYLEYYKARDVALLNSRQRDFYTSLSSFRGIKYISPQTNSNLSIQRERANTRPDMDRNKAVFPGTAPKNSIGFNYQEIIEP